MRKWLKKRKGLVIYLLEYEGIVDAARFEAVRCRASRFHIVTSTTI